jgi:predicted nuclease with TOPRIM domain
LVKQKEKAAQEVNNNKTKLESRCQELESRNYELEQTVKTLMKRIESIELTNIHDNRSETNKGGHIVVVRSTGRVWFCLRAGFYFVILTLRLLFSITVLVTYGYFPIDHTVDMLFDIVKKLESRCQELESRNYELEQTVKTLMKRIESLELTNIHDNRSETNKGNTVSSYLFATAFSSVRIEVCDGTCICCAVESFRIVCCAIF